MIVEQHRQKNGEILSNFTLVNVSDFIDNPRAIDYNISVVDFHAHAREYVFLSL